MAGHAAASGVLTMNGQTGIAAINRAARQKTGTDSYMVNSLGAPMYCWEGDATEVILVDSADLTERARAHIDHFQAMNAALVGDDWIVVGHSTGSCGLGANATAFRLKSDGSVEQLWRDSSPFATWADAVRGIGDAIEIVGHTNRSMGVSDHFVRPDQASPSALRRGDEEFNSGEVFSVRLSRQGIEQRRDFVGAGLPVVPMGMATAADGKNVIFGTVGSRELWMTRD